MKIDKIIMLKEIKKRIAGEVDKISNDLINLSHRIHKNPEVAYQEFKASKWIADFLEDNGFEIQRETGGLKTAFKATKKGKSVSPKIAFLCEYDALPGIGHGCGHNIIATASLGAAASLFPLLDKLHGSIVVLGTPAEEGEGGKIDLLNKGVFKDIDVAMMIHPWSRTRSARSALGRAKLKIEFFGRAAHAGANPEKGINALDAIIQTFNSINAMRQQLPMGVKIHGIITDGGKAPNIIPDYSAGLFYVRAPELKLLDAEMKKFKACAQGAAKATGSRVKISMDPRIYAPRKNNMTLAKIFSGNLKLLGIGEEEEPPWIGSGSSDIGNISQVIPILHADIAICPPKTAGHSKEFAKYAISPGGDEAVITGAKALAFTACDILSNPEIFKKIVDEFNAR